MAGCRHARWMRLPRPARSWLGGQDGLGSLEVKLAGTAPLRLWENFPIDDGAARHAYCGISTWPPKPKRMAERSLSPKVFSTRER